MRKFAWIAMMAMAPSLSSLVSAQDATIRVWVDLTDAPHRILHTHLIVPAKPGPMTLLYPEWIPGEHGPTGPVIDTVGLKITANGQPVAWKRDSVNMYAYHVTVPAGANSLDVAFDQIQPPDNTGFSSGASTTTELAVLNWNQVLMYPEGVPSDQLRYQANLRVPDSWRYGTALPIARESRNEIEFQPSSLTTLVDSPVSAGKHYRTVELGTEGSITHYLHLAGDSDRSIEITPEQVENYKSLVKETGALFGSRHYRSYHFLYTFSDHIASFGLEHHESSDDRVGERGLVDEVGVKANANLLPHEFTHSWNGKIPAAGGSGDGRLQPTDEGRSVVGLRRAHGISGRYSDAAQRNLYARGISRSPGDDRGGAGSQSRTAMAAARGHRSGRAAFV